jgi:hypothetical protein
VLATLYGGGLAELAMFVWPTWEGKRAGEQLTVLFDALHRYAMLVLGAYADSTTFETSPKTCRIGFRPSAIYFIASADVTKA